MLNDECTEGIAFIETRIRLLIVNNNRVYGAKIVTHLRGGEKKRGRL